MESIYFPQSSKNYDSLIGNNGNVPYKFIIAFPSNVPIHLPNIQISNGTTKVIQAYNKKKLMMIYNTQNDGKGENNHFINKIHFFSVCLKLGYLISVVLYVCFDIRLSVSSSINKWYNIDLTEQRERERAIQTHTQRQQNQNLVQGEAHSTYDHNM